MTVKMRNLQDKAAEQFVNEMADKIFGVTERIERITISLDGTLFDKIDEIVRKRKRGKESNRTISAFIREAVETHLLNHK